MRFKETASSNIQNLETKVLFNHEMLRIEERFLNFLPSEEFSAEIEMEARRSDRSSTPLTLILFTLIDQPPRTEAWEDQMMHLASIISRAVRKTDIKGWIWTPHGLRLGLILHNTPQHKVQRIITLVRNHFQKFSGLKLENTKSEVEVLYEIYAYSPNGKVFRDKANPSHRKLG